MPSAGRFNHLPAATSVLMADWQYKGARPTVSPAESVVPTVAFSTVEVKLPATGPTKILEINGFESGLDAYGEERKEQSIIDRSNSIADSLGVPVARYRWRGQRGYREIRRECIPHIAADLRDQAQNFPTLDDLGDPFSIYSSISAHQSSMVKDWLEHRRAIAEEGKPTINSEIENIEDASILVELTDPNVPLMANFDPPDALIANPAEIRLIEEDKLAFASLSGLLGLQEFRPRSSFFWPALPTALMEGDLRTIEDVKDIVLKYPRIECGRGITVLGKDEFAVLANIAGRIGTWGAMLQQLGGKGFVSQSEAFQTEFARGGPMQQLLLEEYVPSKPVTAPDGKVFDATMRLVITSLANRGKITIVPLGAYWKLPDADINESDDSADARISRITKGGNSLPVSNRDFKRAFGDVSSFMSRMIANTRSQTGSSEWTIYKHLTATA